MANRQDKDHTKDLEHQERQRMSAKIGDVITSTLGQSELPQRVQVRPLWKDHYRVNVLVGADAVSSRVLHSYFLVADSEGNILMSNPAMRLPAPAFRLDGKDPSCAKL